MSEDDRAPGETTRRTFLKTIGLSVAAVAAGATGAVTIFNVFDGGDGVPRAYAFSHGEDIALWIGTGERFTIRVLQGTRVLEEHAGVRANGITDLESEYFSAHHIVAPTAA